MQGDSVQLAMSAEDVRLARASAILDAFAQATGVQGGGTPRRYLWTDAFAVMTAVGLYEQTREPRYLQLARDLVEQVHAVLAPAGTDPDHPTARGLRIGKPLPERGPDEPYDPELEWERDGQYYHYLTKWMHALQRLAAASGEARYRTWAIELAQTAHRAFAYPAQDPRALYWKMSIDLTRPLVDAMGAHDALEGLVEAACLGLRKETRELARMCAGRRWITSDPLGAGGLLIAALRLARLVEQGHEDLQPHLAQVLIDAPPSVEAAIATLGGPASRRLAFRELGLALGLQAAARLRAYPSANALERHAHWVEALQDFWLDPAHQAERSWQDHVDINAVTLAACLAPRGVLG
jgi:hypothetical protein